MNVKASNRIITQDAKKNTGCKHCFCSDPNGCASDKSSFGLAIEGLDVDRGLEFFRNNMEIYTKVLQSFDMSTRLLLTRMKRFLSAGNLTDYAVSIHGIRSSSYTIYAQELGEFAERLETAANDGNLEAIEAEHNAFENSIYALLDNIRHALRNAWE